jgi:hypothetical protein
MATEGTLASCIQCVEMAIRLTVPAAKNKELTMPTRRLCAVFYMSLAAIGLANADESDVTLWIGWNVVYSEPVFDEEKNNNIKHENWNAWSISNSETRCETSLRAYGNPRSGEKRVCKPVELSKDDFDHDSHFAVCSHLQPQDLAASTFSLDRRSVESRRVRHFGKWCIESCKGSTRFQVTGPRS